jgi:hypothetical protein
VPAGSLRTSTRSHHCRANHSPRPRAVERPAGRRPAKGSRSPAPVSLTSHNIVRGSAQTRTTPDPPPCSIAWVATEQTAWTNCVTSRTVAAVWVAWEVTKSHTVTSWSTRSNLNHRAGEGTVRLTGLGVRSLGEGVDHPGLVDVTPSSLYRGHRFPVEIISHCVWLYHRFPLSLRDVEEMMAKRGVSVSYDTIHQWCRKFGQTYANGLRRRRPRPGDTWHLNALTQRPNPQPRQPDSAREIPFSDTRTSMTCPYWSIAR